MNGFLNSLELFLQVSAQMGTHVLFATLGAIMGEKVGHLNLGVEGMMLMGASFGFSVAYQTGNPLLAVLAAALAGGVGALIYAFITVTLRGNQVVTGLVLTIFGTGVSGMIGKSISGLALPDSITAAFAAKAIPVLSDIPVIGKMLFDQSIYVQMALVTAVIVYVYLNKTSIGLNTRMVGENPAAADASGIGVTLYKYSNIVAGGCLCGIGGAFLSLVYVPSWQDGITAGAGWIAVALVIFATWNPIRAIAGAYLFGALRGVGFKLQGGIPFLGGVVISSQLLDMLPYLVTILVLVFIGLRKKKENQPPKNLGNPYFREER
ncbi:ABC transporter permease [Papillibacter cinnamivorans]|uniref:Nucleoside ABC transporter membrane protein n=1 Tax=Papillibacter cinnamivorans DSM 12816 TaxID=1122930 RepID=A0A1W2A341_9FIRM|nr:ABC transporter permease [Papillibacter cinnamivorans]SMC55107.1 nucleoside ABC transporter membrane protein [Papillibacter cinnamivorans DSM 12816]